MQLHWIIGAVIDLDTITSCMVKVTWRQVIRAFSKFKAKYLCMCFIHLVHAFARYLVIKTYITRENENFAVAKFTWFCNCLYKLYNYLWSIRYNNHNNNLSVQSSEYVFCICWPKMSFRFSVFLLVNEWNIPKEDNLIWSIRSIDL